MEFNSFVKEHFRIINKVCRAYATPKVPYEDLRQEILTNLWLGLERFRGASKLSTWVYRVAFNSALMAIRNYKPKVETIRFESRLLIFPRKLTTTRPNNLEPYRN